MIKRALNLFICFASATLAEDPVILSDDGQAFYISYNSKAKVVDMYVKVGTDKYFAVGFGSSMSDTNMLIFRGTADCIV